MKKIYLVAIFLPTLLFNSCGEGTSSLSDVKNPTKADSIAFYYARSKGFDYWNESNSDTLLRSEESRKEFLRGVEEGLSAVRDNAAYNHGLMIGMGVGQDILDLKKEYPDIDIPHKLFLSSLKAALKNDSVVDGPQTKADLYKIMDDMARRKEKEDTKTAVDALKKAASEYGMTRINEYLYGKIVSNGDGPVLKDGDKIDVDITAAFTDGTPVGLQFPDEIIVGRNLSSPLISQALRTMKVGQTSQFIASPVQLTPRRYRAGEYKANQIIKFTIRVNSILQAQKESD